MALEGERREPSRVHFAALRSAGLSADNDPRQRQPRYQDFPVAVDIAAGRIELVAELLALEWPRQPRLKVNRPDHRLHGQEPDVSRDPLQCWYALTGVFLVFNTG